MMATTKETQTEAENVEAEGEDGEAAVVAKRKLPLKLILIAAGGLVGMVGAGWGGYHFLFAGKSEAATASMQVKPATFLDLPEVLVNLSGGGAGDRTQYLKVRVVLELPDQALTAQIEP